MHSSILVQSILPIERLQPWAKLLEQHWVSESTVTLWCQFCHVWLFYWINYLVFSVSPLWNIHSLLRKH